MMRIVLNEEDIDAPPPQPIRRKPLFPKRTFSPMTRKMKATLVAMASGVGFVLGFSFFQAAGTFICGCPELPEEKAYFETGPGFALDFIIFLIPVAAILFLAFIAWRSK